ncbi:hypothetical protein AB0G74_10950 [Streptomyces sp. NPDC020875]|uniref:hypothetical protein n=1 Tax=Streptomyces sp. NPDC020875 TaxID=3154898 RepID=UPI0033CA4259
MRTGPERRRHLRFLVLSCLAALTLLGAAATYAVIGPPGDHLWRGKPYPVADPDTVAERVRDESRRIHTALGAPADRAPVFNSLRSTSCRARAMIATERIDRTAVAVRHVWEIDGFDGRTARTAIDRAGEGIAGSGWKNTFRYDDEMNGRGGAGGRYEQPDTGYTLTLQWVASRRTVQINLETPCRKFPAGHPKADDGPLEWVPESPLPS